LSLKQLISPLIGLPVPKYHIYVEYAEPDKTGVRFNVNQEELVRTFSTPYIAGQSFWFLGRLLNPLKVTKTVIFWSYEAADKLKLPNQENLVAAKDKKYLIENILKGKVKGVYLCTEKFLALTENKFAPAQSATPAQVSAFRRVIVVSGTDDTMKHALTGALTKLWLVPVVIREEPCQGRKIVEHFADYADVGLAVVLLSPDDYVFPKGEEPSKRKLCPGQDVIFTLGFLLGKLGKVKVLVFYRELANFVGPMDFEGVNFTAFDDRDSWKLALVRELIKCGYSVDADRLLK
jgi:predicted nucleotide-binding protein